MAKTEEKIFKSLKSKLIKLEKFFEYFNEYSGEGIEFITTIENKIPVDEGTRKRLNLSDEAYTPDYKKNVYVNQDILIKFYDRKLKDSLEKGNSEKLFIIKELVDVKKLPKKYKNEYKWPYNDWLDFLENKLKEISEGVPKVKIEYPPLPECFNDKSYFVSLIKSPRINELFDIHTDGTYHLKNNKKSYLAGLAHQLLNLGKLVNDIKTSQDLARVFCPFFNVNYNAIEEKQFQPDRAKTDYFDFLK